MKNSQSAKALKNAGSGTIDMALSRRRTSDSTTAARSHLSAFDLIAMAAFCGLLAGWSEVAAQVLCKSLIGTNRLYMMTKHFVWLVPLSNLLLFVMAGVLLGLAIQVFPRLFGWLSPRLLCAFTIVPALLVAAPQIYWWAWLTVAVGMAARLVPWLERSRIARRRWAAWGFSGMLGMVAIMAALTFGRPWIALRDERARPLPPDGSPNVLLIVLDTVRADRMSVYDSPRQTTPRLGQLAKRAIRFDEARSTAPWTLASHASLFSGRLPRELGVEWATPLPGKFPTLAETLRSRGYATAGFAANIGYCSYDTGLDRGFTHYEDYWTDLEHLRPFRTAVLFQGAWDITLTLGRWTGSPRLQPLLQYLVAPYRKDAAKVNQQLTGWLSERPEPSRPFFAFLNYYDTHAPYLPPAGASRPFGPGPRTLGDFHVLVGLWETLDKSRLPPRYTRLIQDSYDNCLAYLDSQLGALFETLQSRAWLDNTLVVITSDHGEELGEHGLFEHGESLYRPEIHVPLIVMLPDRKPTPAVIKEPVSLLDLPATIVELTGIATGKPPLPGHSLARLWREPSAEKSTNDHSLAISELYAPNPIDPSHGRSPAKRGPLIAVAEDEYVYIRNVKDGREQLFHETNDPGELDNLAKLESMQPRLKRLRERLVQTPIER